MPKLQYFSQLNLKWSREKIGQTNLTIGRWGCTLTSCCMIINKASGKTVIDPPTAAKLFKFNQNGLIIWGQTQFTPLKFTERGYGYDKQKLKNWLSNKKQFAILEVNNSHWVMADRFSPLFGLIGIDPLGGIAIKIEKKYKITGYAFFIL